MPVTGIPKAATIIINNMGTMAMSASMPGTMILDGCLSAMSVLEFTARGRIHAMISAITAVLMPEKR